MMKNYRLHRKEKLVQYPGAPTQMRYDGLQEEGDKSGLRGIEHRHKSTLTDVPTATPVYTREVYPVTRGWQRRTTPDGTYATQVGPGNQPSITGDVTRGDVSVHKLDGKQGYNRELTASPDRVKETLLPPIKLRPFLTTEYYEKDMKKTSDSKYGYRTAAPASAEWSKGVEGQLAPNKRRNKTKVK